MTALALTGLGSLLLGWLLMFVIPNIAAVGWGVVALGVALLVVAFVIDFRRVRGALTSRRGRFGVGTGVSLSLFVGIVVLANVVSVSVNRRYDLTGVSQFTLTSQTREALADLEEPVDVVTFFSPDTPATIARYARSLLEEYANASEELTIRHEDPDVQPELARRYGLDQFGARYGAVVFRSEAGSRQVYGPQIAREAEHAFTSAILEVTGTRQNKVYFVVGHGERTIGDEYSIAADGLRENLFRVEQLDLLAERAIPDDAAVLIIAGPREPLAAAETELLRRYLADDGRLLLLLDPGYPPVYAQIASEWSVDVPDGVIVDPESFITPYEDVPLVPRDRNSYALSDVYFPGTVAVVPRVDDAAGLRMDALAWTSPAAWLETQPSVDPRQYDEGVDLEGPLAIGALIERPRPGEGDVPLGTRLVVVGDSDFAADPNFRNGSNADLFLTSVNWLAAGEEVISVDRKVLATRRLLLSPEQARFLQVSSIALLPLLLLVSAVAVWWKKR